MLKKLIDKLRSLNKSPVTTYDLNHKEYSADLDRDKNHQISLLNDLQDNKGIHNLPELYWSLINDRYGTKKEVIKTIHSIFTRYPLRRYPYLDSLCRERSSLDWSFDWKNVNTDELFTDSLNVDEKVSALGFLTFHPNGYLREKSIKTLEALNHSSSLPFFLIRLNDWVPEIRDTALAAIDRFIKTSDVKYLAFYMPLIKRLENCGRAHHREFIDNTLKSLSQNKDAIWYGLKSPDNETRRYCFNVAVNSKQFENEELIEIIKADKNGHVRAYCLRQMVDLLNDEEIKRMIPLFFKDKFARVRIEALDLYCKHYLSESEEILKEQLLSDYRSARETAYFYLKKNGKTDIHGYYVKAINIEKVGAISGLSEIGTKDDTELIKPFLESKRGKIVRTAIRGISKLAGKDATSFLLKFLDDKRKGISKEVSTHLIQFKPKDFEEINKIYSNTAFQHVKENAMRILCTGAPWDSLPFIIESYSSNIDGLKNVGTGALKKWLTKITHVYNKPTEEQRVKIEKAIGLNRKSLDENLIKNIEFNINS